MVGGLFLWPALRYGTGYQTVWDIRPSAETPSSIHWRRFYFQLTHVHSTLELSGQYALQIYLLTYLHIQHHFAVSSSSCPSLSSMKSPLLPLLPPPASWLLSVTASFITASTIPSLSQKHNADIITSFSTYLDLCRARLVLRWVTVSGFNSWYATRHPGQLSLPSLREWQIKTSCGWEGKGRYGSFHWRINARCAGKTIRSLENTCHTWEP